MLMRRTLKILIVTIILVCNCFNMAGAEEINQEKQPFANQNYLDRSFTKLGRGIHNIVLSDTEFLIQYMRSFERQGIPSAMTAGIFKGLWRFVTRCAVGAYEIVTFPIPQKAIVKPEFFSIKNIEAEVKKP